jgi:hypothetical protein
VKPVTIEEIRSLEDYAKEREAFRSRILAIKEPRRVRAGEHLTFLFENHDTMLYQIQEMIRVEGISDRAAVAHEVATYNELVPGTDELTATLLVEFEDAGERSVMLKALVGLDAHIRLEIEGEEACRPEFDDRQISDGKISSVHYIRFPLGTRRADALREKKGAEIVVDHPRLSARVALSDAQRAALAEDLSG